MQGFQNWVKFWLILGIKFAARISRFRFSRSLISFPLTLSPLLNHSADQMKWCALRKNLNSSLSANTGVPSFKVSRVPQKYKYSPIHPNLQFTVLCRLNENQKSQIRVKFKTIITFVSRSLASM